MSAIDELLLREYDEPQDFETDREDRLVAAEQGAVEFPCFDGLEERHELGTEGVCVRCGLPLGHQDKL